MGTVVKRSADVSDKKVRIKEILESIPDTNFVTDAEKAAISGISGTTASVAELNILDGATLTTTELNYVDGATSNIQTQLNAKAAALGVDDNYVTDAQLVVIGNTSGMNTGDQTLASLGASAVTDIQVFTADDTWTKPTGAKYVEIICIGGGGGGGSGRKGAASSARGGGGGGGGGGYSSKKLSASLLGATESVVVGVGGTGGVAQTTNSTDGNNGVAGEDSSFGSWVTAQGGGEGGGGLDGIGGYAGDGENSSKFGFVSFEGNKVDRVNEAGAGGVDFDGGGETDNAGHDLTGHGAGGGGISVTNTVFNGGIGLKGSYLKDLIGHAGGTSGSAANGGNGTASTANSPYGGGGGGGGGARHTGGNAYNGGNGGLYGAGAGGGGASTNSVGNSGAGGNGAAGIVIVITYF